MSTPSAGKGYVLTAVQETALLQLFDRISLLESAEWLRGIDAGTLYQMEMDLVKRRGQRRSA